MASMPSKADVFTWANAQVSYDVKRVRLTPASSSQPRLPWENKVSHLVKGHRYILGVQSAEFGKGEAAYRHADTFVIKVNRLGRIVRD
jgi:hypothetical protein